MYIEDHCDDIIMNMYDCMYDCTYTLYIANYMTLNTVGLHLPTGENIMHKAEISWRTCGMSKFTPYTIAARLVRCRFSCQHQLYIAY